MLIFKLVRPEKGLNILPFKKILNQQTSFLNMFKKIHSEMNAPFIPYFDT